VEINQELIDTVVELGSVWGLRVVGAIALLIIGRMICGGLRRATRRALERSGVDDSLVPFVASLVYYAAMAVVVIAVLNLFGIQTASVIAVLGAASLAVGLAMQGTLSNFAAGVMLLVFRPFKIGDYVEVAGTAGGVFEIGIFSTTLHTPDNVKITIPNSAVYGDTVKNYSANATRRNDLTIGISYDDDIGVAISTI
jgi:small conductance mechanosensitive channel